MNRVRAGRRAVALALLVLGAGPAGATSQTSIGAGFRPDPNLDEAIVAIAQGPDGRVWLGSEFGLYVYDGYAVETFVGGPGSAEPFPRGSVRTLLVDRRGRLWVGHGLGLVLVDPVEDRVERVFRHDPLDSLSLTEGDVTSLHEDRHGDLWVGTLGWFAPDAGGLNRLDETSGTFRRFTHDPADPASLSHNRVRTILEDSHGALWVGTWGGLNRRGPGEDGFVHYLHDAGDPGSLAYDDVKQVYEDASGSLWVATIGGGLDRYDPETDDFVHIANPGSDLLMSVAGDEAGRLWVATLDGGLLLLPPGEEALEAVPLAPEAGGAPALLTLAVTADRVLWVAGLASPYGLGRTWRLDLEAPELTVRGPGPIRAVEPGRGRVVWMGRGSQLLRWDRDTDRLRSFDCPGAREANEQQWLSSIVVVPGGAVWFGYWDPDSGLCRLDPGEDAPRRVRVANGERLSWIQEMAWSDGRLWVVSAGRLVAVDPVSGELDIVDPGAPAAESQNLAIERVTADASGDLWWATRDGRLRRRRSEDGAIERFDGALAGFGGAEASFATALRPGADGTVWLVARGAGACAFDPEAGRCRRTLGTGDGLPADRMIDVIEEEDDRLWVVSISDITEVDRRTGALRVLPRPPGAEESRFSIGGVGVGAAGDLYFGTSSGVLAFSSAQARGNPHPPIARITHVDAGEGEPVGIPRGPLRADASTLALPSDRGDLALEYVGLHFADPAENQYMYRLDGLDDAWRNAGTERRARYTNLAPGAYVFRVRAASENGVWGEEATFPFRILAPWWRQPWALALWLALAVAGGLAIRSTARRRRAFAAWLAEERREARRLRELSGAKSRLFADLAHEFRTPLALILAQLRAVRDGSTVDPDRIEMADRQTRELKRLTDEMMELSRLEAGALALDRRPRDLVPLVRTCVADFQGAAEDAGVSLRVDAREEPVRVSVDADRMRRIISNLLSNALKYTPEGGSVVVRVQGASHDRSGPGADRDPVLLSVEDTGVGIPPEALDHVFDRFYRAPGARQCVVRGTGIGLALVRELVELHGGTISVASELDGGTRFDIRLPAVGPVADAPGETGPANGAGEGEPVEPSTSGASRRSLVLVVEDHPDMRAFLRQELAAEHDVEEAADGAAGLARAIELVPDLVITDVVMPVLDGYELVRRLRQDERTSHIPIVMLTGKTSDESRIAGLESGVDEYLAKPFSARVLRSRVENLLELRRLLRSRYAGEIWLKPEEVDAPSIDQKFLVRVAEIIEGRMSDREFSVEELASTVHMSRSQLHRKLVAILGKSPGALIRGMRLERAAHLIRSGSRTLGQIAYETGFGDQAHFSRSFKRQFGCTPSEYADRPAE